ncbi:riboflavin kinase [Candidatus Formimonas warabiya]|uniref:Riboflavin biosynthesis protein n=1 Tax=Formimonas warabiya TaxID=1761012 RepID=A0A3G1L2K7_FORW1|nr:riboflavin kinase [Candidatus Formimonas warabiya]ATW28878.1 hypothetical protein DCMF_24515 [Candidatus Formimonas warabiya]
MDVVTGLKNLNKYHHIVIALGNFDGIHRGHQRLIKKTVELAKQLDGVPSLLFFEPHPMNVLNPNSNFRTLLSIKDKIRMIEQLGIRLLIILPFTQDIANLTPHEFVKSVLVDKLNVKTVVIGYNYTFGYKGAGNVLTMDTLARQYNFRMTVISQYKIRNQEVSSTHARNLLLEGNVSGAAMILGYHPFLWCKAGAVDRWKSGRMIMTLIPGYNVIVPADGVYFAKISLNDDLFESMAYVGIKASTGIKIEAFYLSEDIYGCTICVEFIRRLHDGLRCEENNRLLNA